MPLSRRRFVITGSLAACCALASGARAFGQKSNQSKPAADFAVPHEAKQSAAFYYTHETFEPYVGGVFRGWVGNEPVDLVLVRVKSYTPKAESKLTKGPTRPTRSFTLTFRSDRPLSELTDTHRLEHAALGKLELMLTAGQGEGGKYFYEAVFTHLD